MITQIIILCLSTFGLFLQIFAYFRPHWTKQARASSEISHLGTSYEGLWYRCNTRGLKGDFSCDNYTRPFFTLGKLLFLRIAYGSACSLGLLALFNGTIGCDSILILDVYLPQKFRRKISIYKRMLIFSSGIFYLISGALSFLTCCVYAGIVTSVFYKQDALKKISHSDVTAQVRSMYEVRLIIGNGLWQGWAGGVILIFAGLGLILISIKKKKRQTLREKGSLIHQPAGFSGGMRIPYGNLVLNGPVYRNQERRYSRSESINESKRSWSRSEEEQYSNSFYYP